MTRAELEALAGWQPINATTPAKWHQFYGKQIAGSTFGVAAAFCPTAWYFGIELLTDGSRGIAICIGPVWIGFAALRANTTLDPKDRKNEKDQTSETHA